MIGVGLPPQLLSQQHFVGDVASGDHVAIDGLIVAQVGNPNLVPTPAPGEVLERKHRRITGGITSTQMVSERLSIGRTRQRDQIVTRRRPGSQQMVARLGPVDDPTSQVDHERAVRRVVEQGFEPSPLTRSAFGAVSFPLCAESGCEHQPEGGDHGDARQDDRSECLLFGGCRSGVRVGR